MTGPAVPALQVTVVARQRLALGVDAEVSYYTASHRYVPGSVLRGALAAAFIAEHGPPTSGNPAADRFRALFDGRIRFGALLPAGSSRMPLSVHRCKYPVDDACRSVVVDRAFEDTTHCPSPSCRRRLVAGRGQLDLPPGTALQRSTRTSINPDGRAKEGELYAHAALPAGTRLTGTVHGRDEWLEQPRTLWLGGRRTVGGQVDYQCAPVGLPAVPPRPPGAPLVIRLASPAVFVDLAGRPRLDPDPVLDLGDPDAGPEAGSGSGGATLRPPPWARSVTWSGWHAASSLPKPAELCAEAGSTYLVDGPADLLTRLAGRLLTEGIGLRRAEGFGAVELPTGPWCPSRPSRPSTVADTPAPGSDPVEPFRRQLQNLKLDKTGWRWLTGALRALQIESQRPGTEQARIEAIDALLAQPAALDLSGRQRQHLRDVFVACTGPVLRDLTTLVLTTRDGNPEPL